MTALRTWALFVLTWSAMATLARADSIAIPWDWTAWTQSSVVRGNSVAADPVKPSNSNTTPDAYLNFGTSSYPEQGALTVGTDQPWYVSPSVTKVYGGNTPTAAEQQDFIHNVVNDVQHTFDASGLTGSNQVVLTTDPNAGARHTMSIASGLSYGPNPIAIGITDIGNNGFSFIDKLSYASTPQELEWAVAHNITHELMHAFGVAAHDDTTGNYLDAATAHWNLLTSPDATLSQAAVNDVIGTNVGRDGNYSLGLGHEALGIDGAQEILAPVPEPSTIASWGLAATVLILQQWRRAMRRRAA